MGIHVGSGNQTNMKAIRHNHSLKIALICISTIALTAGFVWSALRASVFPISRVGGLVPLCLVIAVTIFEARRRHPQA